LWQGGWKVAGWGEGPKKLTMATGKKEIRGGGGDNPAMPKKDPKGKAADQSSCVPFEKSGLGRNGREQLPRGTWGQRPSKGVFFLPKTSTLESDGGKQKNGSLLVPRHYEGELGDVVIRQKKSLKKKPGFI